MNAMYNFEYLQGRNVKNTIHSSYVSTHVVPVYVGTPETFSPMRVTNDHPPFPYTLKVDHGDAEAPFGKVDVVQVCNGLHNAGSDGECKSTDVVGSSLFGRIQSESRE
eukprot:2043808-Rhodomonas_salina.1